MFLVMREIRGKTALQIAEILSKRLEGETETFASTDRFRLNAMNRRQIHRLLARITDYVETSCGLSSRYAEYVQRKGRNGYEIEHIWEQNLLAQSLHELAYERNPRFLRLTEEKILPFRAHAEFKKADLDARQQLYRLIADHIWSPARLHRELASEASTI